MVGRGSDNIRMFTYSKISNREMIRRLKTTIMLLVLSVCACTAQQSDAQVREKISSTAAQMKSMECDFVQTKYLKLLSDKMVSRGKMYYRQPNQLRWEYTKPYAYTFIINGSQVLVKNQQRSDVIDTDRNKMFKEIGRIMMNSVVGKSMADDKDFRVSIGSTATAWTATLLPRRKDMKRMFERIILHFDKKKMMISAVEMVEKKGDRTVIELKNVRSNVGINANLFSVH